MLLIKNGTIVNPAKHQHEVTNILVEDGKILTREVKGNVKKKFLREGVEDPFG